MYQSSQSVTEDSQSWGCGSIYPGYTASTITNRHESKAIITRSLHGVHLSVGVLGAACNSVVTTESFMLPFAYLCTRPSPHSVSAVRGARPGLVLACMDYDGILLVILLQQAAAAAAYGQCDFHRQPGGQQQY